MKSENGKPINIGDRVKVVAYSNGLPGTIEVGIETTVEWIYRGYVGVAYETDHGSPTVACIPSDLRVL